MGDTIKTWPSFIVEPVPFNASGQPLLLFWVSCQPNFTLDVISRNNLLHGRAFLGSREAEFNIRPFSRAFAIASSKCNAQNSLRLFLGRNRRYAMTGGERAGSTPYGPNRVHSGRKFRRRHPGLIPTTLTPRAGEHRCSAPDRSPRQFFFFFFKCRQTAALISPSFSPSPVLSWYHGGPRYAVGEGRGEGGALRSRVQ